MDGQAPITSELQDDAAFLEACKAEVEAAMLQLDDAMIAQDAATPLSSVQFWAGLLDAPSFGAAR